MRPNHHERDLRSDYVADASSSGEISAAIEPALSARRTSSTGCPSAAQHVHQRLVGEADANPAKIVAALKVPPSSPLGLCGRDEASRDSADAPASAPRAGGAFGYLSSPWRCTINARRSGTIIRMPRSPPRTRPAAPRHSRSKPRIMIAGMVTPMRTRSTRLRCARLDDVVLEDGRVLAAGFRQSGTA